MRIALRASLVALGVMASLTVLQLARAGDEKPGKGKSEIDPKDGQRVAINAKLTDKDVTDKKRDNCHCKIYTLKVIEGAKYTIEMRSNDLDSYLRLEDPSGEQVAEDDDSGGGNTGLDARIEYTAAKSGKFKIIATTYAANTTGDFTLSVRRDGGGKVVAGGGGGGKGGDFKVFKGQLTDKDNKDKVRQNSYCKIYPIKLLAGQSYTIDMKSSDDGFDSYLRLEDPDGNQIAEDDDGGGFPNARITQQIEKTGVYKIIATTFGANTTGNFVVEVRGKGVGDAGGAAGGGGDSAAGSTKTYKGQLTNDDPEYPGRKGSYFKSYTHKFVKGHTYTIDMKSTDFDSYLFLENAKGTKVGEDDDSGGDLNARIEYKATQTGKFKIVATTYKAGDTGSFTLEIKDSGGVTEEPKENVSGKAIKEGITKGQITGDDKKYVNRNDSYFKSYTFKMKANKTYVVDLRSTDFDAYLFIEDPAGKVLAEDDDSGGNLNSRIEFACPKDGTYRLIVTTFAGNTTGNYELEVRAKE